MSCQEKGIYQRDSWIFSCKDAMEPIWKFNMPLILRFIWIRTMLCEELEYWGPGSFQQQLDKAYQDFVAFCRARKLDQSQPPFKESKATRFKFIVYIPARPGYTEPPWFWIY